MSDSSLLPAAIMIFKSLTISKSMAPARVVVDDIIGFGNFTFSITSPLTTGVLLKSSLMQLVQRSTPNSKRKMSALLYR